MRSKSIVGLVILFVLSNPAFAGEIVAWGWNNYGQCDVPTGNDFIAIAGGHDHSLALRADGSLAGWGRNTWGQADVPTLQPAMTSSAY